MAVDDLKRSLINGHASPQIELPEGPLQYRVRSSDDGLIRLDFNRPVSWMAMRVEEAKHFAETILKHVRLRGAGQ